jgi:hypothetical protein
MLGPNSRLGQEIQRILKEHPDGLTLDDLEIELRQRGFQSSTPSIRKVLSHRDVFFPIAGGRYALRSIVEAAGDVEAEAPKAESSHLVGGSLFDLDDRIVGHVCDKHVPFRECMALVTLLCPIVGHNIRSTRRQVSG